MVVGSSSGSGFVLVFALARMADAEEDDSAEWLRELVGFSLPAASVQVDDSTEWLHELVGLSAAPAAPSVQVDDSTEW